MTTTVVIRKPFQGTVAILRYNRGFYVGGFIALAVGAVALRVLSWPSWLAVVGVAGLIVGAWWWVASILVSWWVYDASDLMGWRWLGPLVTGAPGRWANMHAGLDESSPSLIEMWGAPVGVFDFFDAGEMTEPSILRARQLAENEIRPDVADYRQLPLADESVDVLTLLFAAHELRSEGARDTLFGELRRVLAPGGRVMLVEHLRDPANFVAFGPGFMHFMPRREWLRLASAHRFAVSRQERKTPFVGAFLLEKQ